MVITHEPLHLDRWSFMQWKIVDVFTSFIFFNGPLKYGDGGIFKLLRWMQSLHQSIWDHKMLYADRSLEDGQVLIGSLLQKFKNMNTAGVRMLKFTFYFMERTPKPFQLVRWSFVHWKIVEIPYTFYFDHYFLCRSFFNMVVDILRLCWNKHWTTLCRIL
jgi:hypothetical protein